MKTFTLNKNLTALLRMCMCCLILVGISGKAWAQKTSLSSGNWNDPSIWSPFGVPGGLAENVTIVAMHTVTLLAGSTGTALNLTINGTLVLATTTIAPFSTLNISGNFANNGSFTANAGTTVIFNGAGAQTIEGTATLTTFTNLTISKPVGTTVTLVGTPSPVTVTVSNALTLTSGRIVLGNNNLSYGGINANLASSLTSYIQADGGGLFIRTNATTGASNFPIGDATQRRNVFLLAGFSNPTSVRLTTTINPPLPSGASNTLAGMWVMSGTGN